MNNIGRARGRMKRGYEIGSGPQGGFGSRRKVIVRFWVEKEGGGS